MRILVVDDSAFHRMSLLTALRELKNVSEVETASSGQEALRMLSRGRFDLVTLDIEMPGMDGFAVLRWIMANRPVPVLIVSDGAAQRSVMAALEFGAFEVMGKPSPRTGARDDWKVQLGRALETASQLRLEALQRRAGAEESSLPPSTSDPAEVRHPLSVEAGLGGLGAIAIASSTGGPPALRDLLRAFSPRPVVVAIAQHMPSPFTKSLATRLAATTGWDVREARDAEKVLPGQVVIAPGGLHLELLRSGGDVFTGVRDDGRGARWCPSGDLLLSSVASAFGTSSVGVVLTGMGNDGAEGSAHIVKAGGRVLLEGRETAVISGMPDAAHRRVPEAQRLPLPRLAEELCQFFPLGTLDGSV
ncbi:MAG: chemotaxis protein CheB [Acidobacteria bacterium]|nr:chemotaxis protein CheB [Acidobacteriota bacterium]MCG3194359.1 Chemotaxis response regulator protein-glutamate methylesterase [Thermoanaerobaculia bacterium]MCK6682532.1 chemotaxis protein CheB [Thermoanaerobaculia bacterium]